MEKKTTLFQLTWPILIEAFFFMLLGSVDIFMLSQYSDNSVGAVGVVNQIVGMSGLVFAIITSGTSIICAQYIGAGKTSKEKNKLIAAALQVNALFGIVMSIIMFVFSRQLLDFMNLDSALMEDGMAYMTIVGGFVFVQSIENTFSAVLRSHGKTKICMVITLIMNGLNVIMNYVLIFGLGPIPSLGVKGAAISTTLSKCVALVALGIIMFKQIAPDFKVTLLVKINKLEIGKILKLGIPSAGETISYNVARLFITRILTAIGTAAVIANSYISTITNYNYLFAVAIAQGTAILIGWKIGAGKKEEAYSLCLKSFWKALAVSMGITLVCAVFGKYILQFFTDDTTIIQLGMTVFIIDFINEAGRCANLVIINALRAAGDVRFPVFAGVFSMWGVGLLLSYVFGIVLDMGFPGVWLAMGLDEVVRGVMMYIRWKRKRWKKYSQVEDTPKLVEE
ncbi:MAG: MATE family efflux transporter [Clostridiales bacterium]|nr:MATE family efflux transporter [Clostridiales bacterium]